MRVAFFVGAFPMTTETFVVNAAKKVLDAGHELDIYAVDPMFKQTSEVQGTVAEYGMTDRAYSPNVPQGAGKVWGLAAAFGKVLHARGPAALNLLTRPSPDGARTMARAIFDASALQGRAEYDVIHVHFATLAGRVLQLRRAGLLSGKVLVHFRGGDISSYVRAQGEDVYDAVFREADGFVANCAHFRDKAIGLGAPADRIGILPSGLDRSRFSFKERHLPAEGPVKLIAVGRLVPKKGLKDAIGAMPLIEAKSGTELTLIGDGPLRDELEAQAASLGVADRVHFLGAKSLDEVSRALMDSHIFLGPSVTAPDGNQDAPINTLKEAMATGLPVVATRHGGIPELVEDGLSGFLVPEHDPEALAAAVTRLIRQAERWPEMGQRGAWKVAKDYDLEKTGEHMLNIYASLASEEGIPL
ncbi:glycosyltransferase [Parvularcula maris]|uniref:Glycosyltransferase n=1 Tax=Parvularcula maris TaxID=2965077 RepID=A0A9X2RIP8_9PROT|nr:glycosyltransferase [Parvularcula maris]MCQ8186315.1 glycosyltransferase [Parvularcula maris]